MKNFYLFVFNSINRAIFVEKKLGPTNPLNLVFHDRLFRKLNATEAKVTNSS